MMAMPVKKQSGAEPAYVPPPKHSAGNLVVSMESRFTERDLNTLGRIRDTYVDAMHLVLVRLSNLTTWRESSLDDATLLHSSRGCESALVSRWSGWIS